ncbi:MAG: hypothetical protein WD766_07965 [Gemmatimonadota bacterium]
MSDEDRRQTRKEIRLLQGESVWLQKALFALRKAEASREKLEDDSAEELEPYAFTIQGETVLLEDIEEAIDQRAEKLVQTVREMRRSLR